MGGKRSVLDRNGLGGMVLTLWKHYGYSGKMIADELRRVTNGEVHLTDRSILRWLNRQGIFTDKEYSFKVVRCKQCGKLFKKHRYLWRKSKDHFCCKEHYWEYLNNPEYNRNVWMMRKAREELVQCGFLRSPENVVHHIDGNTENNDFTNLMVFKNQSDHSRWHRGDRSLVEPLWAGSGNTEGGRDKA